jgi:hypothetical protein
VCAVAGRHAGLDRACDLGPRSTRQAASAGTKAQGSTPGPSPFLRPGHAFYANPNAIAMTVTAWRRRLALIHVVLLTRSDPPHRFTSRAPRIFASFDTRPS